MGRGIRADQLVQFPPQSASATIVENPRAISETVASEEMLHGCLWRPSAVSRFRPANRRGGPLYLAWSAGGRRRPFSFRYVRPEGSDRHNVPGKSCRSAEPGWSQRGTAAVSRGHAGGGGALTCQSTNEESPTTPLNVES
jgi:hypothetical protein